MSIISRITALIMSVIMGLLSFFGVANVEKGIWNVMPIYYGDHMSLQGGMTVVNNVKPLYVEHLSMINSL